MGSTQANAEIGEDISPTLTARQYKDPPVVGALVARDYKGVGNQYVEEGKLIVDERVRRLTPLECERLQGFPSIVELNGADMTSDDLIACALANGDVVVDFDTGKVFGTRGPGGMTLEKLRELGFEHPTGYIHINLSAGGEKKQVRAHRIVYMAAHGEIPEGMVIDHVNGVKNDNRLSNLQLLTPEDNSHKAKFDGAYEGNSNPDKNKRMIPYEIREKIIYHRGEGLTYRELAEKYGCSKSTVANIIKERGWTDIPYKGKEHPPDSVRYKALGNSFAVPVVKWIGERIQMVEEIRCSNSN